MRKGEGADGQRAKVMGNFSTDGERSVTYNSVGLEVQVVFNLLTALLHEYKVAVREDCTYFHCLLVHDIC